MSLKPDPGFVQNREMKTLMNLDNLTSIDQLAEFLSGTQAVAFSVLSSPPPSRDRDSRPDEGQWLLPTADHPLDCPVQQKRHAQTPPEDRGGLSLEVHPRRFNCVPDAAPVTPDRNDRT